MKIKYVNAPKKEGGKFGNIKMESGETFFVNVGRLNLYRTGMEIEPPSKSEKWGDNVVQVIPANYDPTGGSAPNAAPPLNPAYNQEPAPPPVGWQRPSAPVSNGNGGCSPKDVQITAIALMKSYIETGKFGLTDLPVLEAACIPAAKRIVAGSQ